MGKATMKFTPYMTISIWLLEVLTDVIYRDALDLGPKLVCSLPS